MPTLVNAPAIGKRIEVVGNGVLAELGAANRIVAQ